MNKKKKIVFIILGMLVLIGAQISLNIFLFKRGNGALITAPIWFIVYYTYAFLISKLIKK